MDDFDQTSIKASIMHLEEKEISIVQENITIKMDVDLKEDMIIEEEVQTNGDVSTKESDRTNNEASFSLKTPRYLRGDHFKKLIDRKSC